MHVTINVINNIYHCTPTPRTVLAQRKSAIQELGKGRKRRRETWSQVRVIIMKMLYIDFQLLNLIYGQNSITISLLN